MYLFDIEKILNSIVVIYNKNNKYIKNNKEEYKMGTISVSVEDEMKSRMGELEEINWSAVARKAFEDKLKEVEILKKLASKSKLTVKDANEISSRINESMAKKFRSM